jgi:hypothetical protein
VLGLAAALTPCQYSRGGLGSSAHSLTTQSWWAWQQRSLVAYKDWGKHGSSAHSAAIPMSHAGLFKLFSSIVQLCRNFIFSSAFHPPPTPCPPPILFHSEKCGNKCGMKHFSAPLILLAGLFHYSLPFWFKIIIILLRTSPNARLPSCPMQLYMILCPTFYQFHYFVRVLQGSYRRKIYRPSSFQTYCEVCYFS